MCQLELFDKIIEIKVVTSSGHKTHKIAVTDVQDFISRTANEKRLWLYLDGIHFDPEEITQSIICSSKEIILTNALIGG